MREGVRENVAGTWLQGRQARYCCCSGRQLLLLLCARDASLLRCEATMMAVIHGVAMADGVRREDGTNTATGKRGERRCRTQFVIRSCYLSCCAAWCWRDCINVKLMNNG